MPRIKSAIKRVEVTERNRQRNRAWKSAVRTMRNKVEQAIDSSDGHQAAEALKAAYSTIDRAVSKGVLHKNSAARKKAALAIKLSKLSPAKAPAAKPARKSRAK